MKIVAGNSELNYCCGVDEVGGFEFEDPSNSWASSLTQAIEKTRDGTGYFIATFIDDEVCKQAYHELCEKATLMYQSPPRFNPRHGVNEVFVCVFLYKDIK